MEVAFWISLLGVAYAYFGYPFVLMLIGAGRRSRSDSTLLEPDSAPSVSLLIPAHNEQDVIGQKIENSLSLYYPGTWQVIVVSDGSSDGTSQIASSYSGDNRLTFVDLPERKGKANALNVGVELAEGEIVVFSDASILLDHNALWEIVRPFGDRSIGCVSGEDKIDGGGGEGLYGRYELSLRRQESKLGSIVGASGSLYAQRKSLVESFPEGVAPDFLSVLNTVRNGRRAISTSQAIGYMTAIEDSKDEFRRKVRTVIRGMTALFRNKALLNPGRYPLFSFFLLSHKLMRWYGPIFLLILFVANAGLLYAFPYQIFLLAQSIFYVMAALCLINENLVNRIPVARVALYFTVSNAAILVAWWKYFLGVRQEIWGPSKRGAQH